MAWTWTASSWRSASKEGKFWRSSEFNRIETAVGRYNPRGDENVRLAGLKAILDAISAWRVYKQEKKGGDAFVSPRGSASDATTKIAAAENKLVGPGQTLSVRSDVADRLVRDVVTEVDEVLDQLRSAWGGRTFSDLTRHDQDDFRYLVSAQSESRELVEHRERTIANPALIADAVISATVITESSVRLWGPSGFVLQAPHSCIGAAAARDVGTRNAVALGHELEKYREMLRLFIGGTGSPGTGLPAPTALRRETGHNEVAVLGRNYGQTTSVTGVFIIVDEVADTVAGIQPVTVGRVVANVIRKGTTVQQPVVEFLPGVTAHRMAQYRELHQNNGLHVLQIKATAAVEINGAYWGNLYDGDVFRCPLPATALEHGSRGHLDVMRNRAQYNINYFKDHDRDCRICGAA